MLGVCKCCGKPLIEGYVAERLDSPLKFCSLFCYKKYDFERRQNELFTSVKKVGRALGRQIS